MLFFGTEVDIALYLDSFSLEIVVKMFYPIGRGKESSNCLKCLP